MKPEKAPAVNASAINLVGVVFAVLLGVQILLMPPVSYGLTVLSPYLASTVIMLGLGPYLFVPPMCGWWLTAILYAAHLAFVAALVRRMRLWNCFGRGGDVLVCRNMIECLRPEDKGGVKCRRCMC